jgi:hypothetical protein
MGAFAHACEGFLMALGDVALADRDAAFAGEEAVLAGYTAHIMDPGVAMEAIKRLRKLTA